MCVYVCVCAYECSSLRHQRKVLGSPWAVVTGFITIVYMVCERACMHEREGGREWGREYVSVGVTRHSLFVCGQRIAFRSQFCLSTFQASLSGGQSCLVSTFHLLGHLASPETGLSRHVIYRVKFTFHGDTGTN